MNKFKMWMISKIIGGKTCAIATLDGERAQIHTRGNAFNLVDLTTNAIRLIIENQVEENNRIVFWEAVRDYADKKASAIAEEH